MTKSPPNCDLYLPGHKVHWIQWKRASDRPFSWGRLEEVSGQVIAVRYLDRIGRYRNHHAEELLDLAQIGAKIRVNEGYGLLGLPRENGTTRFFCIADPAQAWRACSVAGNQPASFGDLVDRLEHRGGFNIPGELLQEFDQERQ